MGVESSNVSLLKNKLVAGDYVSKALFEQIMSAFPNLQQINFNLDNYNQKVLKRQYRQYQAYFDTIFQEINPKIKLDEEQIRAILADEDFALIIAGAGTGKTTTLIAKVKYLVDIKKVDPEKILVMSYTRKSVQELRDRINIDLGIPATVTTFHSLGFGYLRQLFKSKKCYVVGTNERRRIFLDFIKTRVYTSSYKMIDFMTCFSESAIDVPWVYGDFLKAHVNEYNNYDDYLTAYWHHKINEANDVKKVVDDWIERNINRELPRTIKGEFVKSKGEAQIANFYFCMVLNMNMSEFMIN